MIDWILRRVRRHKEDEVPAHTHVVRDAITTNVIYRGDQESCSKYVSAFGACYVETT